MSKPTTDNPKNFVPIPIWRKGEALLLENSGELRPGDTLIIPSDRREHLSNLLPLPANAADQHEAAHLSARDRIAVRFTAQLCDQLTHDLPEDIRPAFREATAPCFNIPEEEETWIFDSKTWKTAIPRFAAILAEHLCSDHPQKILWQHAAWTNLTSDPKPRLSDDWTFTSYPEGSHRGALLINKSRVGATPWPIDPIDLGFQGNIANEPITLDNHSHGVVRRTEANASRLAEALRLCLRDAAWLHDLGKLDPRFQALLHRCFLHAVAGRELLAKSDHSGNARSVAALRLALGLPAGFRHELISAKIIADAAAWQAHPERELLLHLIASHHGRCRGFAPVIPDVQPEPFEVCTEALNATYAGSTAPMASLAEGVPARFWSLNRRFGWWGLPYLEALLRLADQAESANPS